MPKSVIGAMFYGKERIAIAKLAVGLIESYRDDYQKYETNYPGQMSKVEAFELILILISMLNVHGVGRAATASALSRSTEIPRATVQRRLAFLTKVGAVERRGASYVVSVQYVNQPTIVSGFKRRSNMVIEAGKKLVAHREHLAAA